MSAVWSWKQAAIISLPCINPAAYAIDIQCIVCEVRARRPKIFLETSAIEGLILPTGYEFSGKCRVSRPPNVISQIVCPCISATRIF
jgi:hypothetical protein